MISRLTKWTLGGFLAVVALVAIADGVLRFTRLEERLKPAIGRALAQSGLHFTVTGPINAALLPSPRIEASKITLRNSRGQLLAKADHATIKLALLPLLRAAIVVDEMSIEQPQVEFIVGEDGHSNFDLATPGAGGPPPGGKLLLKGGTLAVDHPWIGKLKVDLQEVTAELGEGHDWLRASGRGLVDKKAVAFKAEAEPKAKGVHRSVIALDTAWGNFAFDGELSELSLQVRATGKASGKLLNPAEFMTGSDLPPIVRRAVSLEMDLDATLSGGKVPRFVLTGSNTEMTGNFVVALAPRFKVDGEVRIANLVFEEFMRTTVDWFGLAELVYEAISRIVDGVPGRGIANLIVDIERGQYNGQTIRGIGIDINVDDHVGTLRKLVARLPGDTELDVRATMRGPRRQREANGRLELTGNRLAHTLRWLVPTALQTRPAPAVERTAPFKIVLDLSRRPDGAHQADASLLLDGVEGNIATTIRFGSLLQLDSNIGIGLVDPLPYLPLSGPDVPQRLRLIGVNIGSDVTIDTTNFDRTAIEVRRAVIDIAGVEAGYDQPILSAPTAPAQPATPILPTQLVGGWLGDLPRRVTDYTRPGPERSAVAKMMPEIEAALRMMDARLHRLDFTSPLEVAVGRLAARDPRHDMVLTNFKATIAAAKPADARTTINVLKPRITLGESRIDDLRIERATLDFEANLERSAGGPTRLAAVKVNELALDGDLDDRLQPEALPGIIGPTTTMRRLPISLRASGEGRGGTFAARVARLSVGDVASFNDVELKVEERKDGVLSVVAATAGSAGAGVPRAPLRCTVTPRGAPSPPMLEFRINLTGADASRHGGYDALEPTRRASTVRRAPLFGGVQSEGFVTDRAVVVRELQLRLGESSTLAARLAVTSPNRADGSLAHLDGCLDATLQSQPRLSSLGHLSQELLLPLLMPLWPGGAEAIRIAAEGGLQLTSDAMAGHVPLRVGIDRRVGNRPAGVDLIELELDALRVQLQPRRSTLQVSFNGIRLRDGKDELKFAAPPGTTLVAMEQASETRRGCEGGANLRADIRLGTVDTINVPMVQRFMDRIDQATRGGRRPGQATGGQACDPLSLTVMAAEIGALPDLVRTLTDAPKIVSTAERAPRLRDLNLKLAVGKDNVITFDVTGGLTATRAGIFQQCHSVNPRTKRARDFDAGGTARFDTRNKTWSAALKGNLTCLDLVAAQELAEIAAGLPLKGIGASVRQGDIEILSFDVTVPPVASLGDLTRASGTVDFVGDLALNIDSALYRAGAGLYGLQDVMNRGVLVGGRIDLRNGELSGTLASKDPALGNPRHDDHPHVVQWPDVASIAFRGSLARTLEVDVTVRSNRWLPVKGIRSVCFDKARREKNDYFPAWVQGVTVCTPVSKTGRCGAMAWREFAERDYAC